MWNAVPIVEDIYGFQLEQNNDDVWVSTAVIKESTNSLTIHVDVHMTYIDTEEKLDELLSAIRSFSKNQKNNRKKEQCMIKFHCLGICLFKGDFDLSPTIFENGYSVIDKEFVEIVSL